MSIKRLFNQVENNITGANLSLNQQNKPTLTRFSDIPISTIHGLENSHYVLIKHNQLIERWSATTQNFYVIGEIGFGSGLHFLITWQAFQYFRTTNPDHPLRRLYFTSFEQYPLKINDLAEIHACWPQLAIHAAQLQHQYPLPVNGCHRLSFDMDCNDSAQIILDLWIGDINDTIIDISCGDNGAIDAWFLDSFTPEIKTNMWNKNLYNNIAKLSTNNATFATFTTDNHIISGLNQVGFLIKKSKGDGKTRKIITGSFTRLTKYSNHNPWFYRPALKLSENQSPIVTIVGGGIASASLALALTKRRINCRVICQDPTLAHGASGNRQGGFYPLLNSNHDHLSQFYSQSFLFALAIYRPFLEFEPRCGEFCGVLQIAYNDKSRRAQDKLISSQHFPPSLVNQLTPESAAQVSGMDIGHGGIFYPEGGWLSPQNLTNSLMKKAEDSGYLTLVYDRKITAFNQQKNASSWQLTCSDSTTLDTSVVVLANGHGLSSFKQSQHLPLYATAGQVTHIKATKHTARLKTVLCYKGYLTPASDHLHCLGASFNRDISGYEVNDVEHHQNIDKLRQDLPVLCQEQNFSSYIKGGKVGVRMSVKDHLPMVGSLPHYENTKLAYHDLNKGKPANNYPNSPVHSNLFMLGGLGSRGLCSAPILGEILACQLLQEPMPLAQSLLEQLNPNRYWIKQLKKHNVNI